VDQVMARSQDEKGADKANAIRKSQSRDRVALAKDIEANQKLVIQLNDEAAPIRAEVRKVEADVGPIKYIAAFIYGDNPDANVLEKAVTWITILIVIVLDPLAVVLLLASQYAFAWAKEEKERSWIDDQVDELNESAFVADEILKAGVTNSDPTDNVPIVEQAFEGVRDPNTGEWIQTGPSFEYEVHPDEGHADVPKYEPDDGPLTQNQIDQVNRSVVDYKILDDFSDPDWHEPVTTFTHEPDRIIVHDEAGTMVIPLERELPVAEHHTDGYVTIDGQVYHESAAPPHVKEDAITYVQNEEQAESNQWMNVVSKTQTVSENEYLDTLEKKKQNDGK